MPLQLLISFEEERVKAEPEYYALEIAKAIEAAGVPAAAVEKIEPGVWGWNGNDFIPNRVSRLFTVHLK